MNWIGELVFEIIPQVYECMCVSHGGRTLTGKCVFCVQCMMLVAARFRARFAVARLACQAGLNARR